VKGKIKSLMHGQGAGYIRDAEGRNLFFHKRDLKDVRYSDLEVGTPVEFDPIEDRVSGSRAERVRLVSKAKKRPKPE